MVVIATRANNSALSFETNDLYYQPRVKQASIFIDDPIALWLTGAAKLYPKAADGGIRFAVHIYINGPISVCCHV